MLYTGQSSMNNNKMFKAKIEKKGKYYIKIKLYERVHSSRFRKYF